MPIKDYNALRAKARQRIAAKRRVAEAASPQAPDEWVTFHSVEDAMAFLRGQTDPKAPKKNAPR